MTVTNERARQVAQALHRELLLKPRGLVTLEEKFIMAATPEKARAVEALNTETEPAPAPELETTVVEPASAHVKVGRLEIRLLGQEGDGIFLDGRKVEGVQHLTLDCEAPWDMSVTMKIPLLPARMKNRDG
jgi:hypothetical protein